MIHKKGEADMAVKTRTHGCFRSYFFYVFFPLCFCCCCCFRQSLSGEQHPQSVTEGEGPQVITGGRARGKKNALVHTHIFPARLRTRLETLFRCFVPVVLQLPRWPPRNLSSLLKKGGGDGAGGEGSVPVPSPVPSSVPGPAPAPSSTGSPPPSPSRTEGSSPLLVPPPPLGRASTGRPAGT